MASITPFANVDKKISIIKKLIDPQLGYCYLIRVFNDRECNKKQAIVPTGT